MAKEPVKKNEEKKNKSFFKEFRAELKRVSWPTLKQLVNNTAIVIGIVVLVAAIVFVLDVIFKNANSFGVDRLKALVTSSSSETAEESTDATDSETAEEPADGTSESELTVEPEAEGEATETNEATQDSVEEN